MALSLIVVAGCNRSAPPANVSVATTFEQARPIDTTQPAPAVAKSESDSAASEDVAADDAPEVGDATPDDSPSAPDARSTERLILFLPAGPLVVELRMTIDGEPFRAARDELIDDALKLADRDGDGQATWSEIMSDSKRVFMQRYDLSMNNVGRKEFLKTYDTNQNGLIDRDEARRIVARAKSAGAAFSLESSSEYRQSNQRQSIVRTMLDVNEDDVLDEAELNAASERLLSRDANDDHILLWSELDDSLAGDEQAMMANQSAYLKQPAALRLGDQADWDGIAYLLADLYVGGGRPPEEAFSLAPSLAAALDENGDGELTYEEIHRLNAVEPQIVLAANFGKPGDKVAGVSLVSLSPELGAADRLVQHTSHGVVLSLGGYRLQIVLDDRAPANSGEPPPEEQLAALDKDKNGYVDKEEAAELAPDVKRMFDEVDTNGDGKVYLDELTAYRRKQRAPQLSAIRAVASDDQDVLFPLIDANHDGRLTARELHDARKALTVLDADGDGRISLEELPGALTLTLSRGLPSNMSPRRSGYLVMQDTVAPSGPAWFVHMDANRDQEVSLDEFPGKPEKFRALDVDGDGFVSSSEALAAGQ
jgi:Ca2+-binding EF-hand superfamily protein